MSLFCDITCAIALFIFGITLLGEGLDNLAKGTVERAVQKATGNRMRGFLTGTAVTAVVQSSAAVSVLTAELSQSGVLALRQTIPVLIGANVGTTVTAWLLCASRELPYSEMISALLGLIGTGLYLMPSRRQWGRVVLGMFLLLSGMKAVTAAVLPLTRTAWVTRLLAASQRPMWGLLSGILLTVLTQSSSVSVGLLQALSASGRLCYAAAIPMVLGQNIGTCLMVFLVALGGKHRAGQAAWAHLLFNVIGSAITLFLLGVIKLFRFTDILVHTVDFMGVAMIHTMFNLSSAAVFLPLNETFAMWIERFTVRPWSGSANR